MKLAVTVLLFLALLTCNERDPLSVSFEQLQAKLQRGESSAVVDESERQFQRWRTNAEWSWRFRILEAEALTSKGQSREALELLDKDFPSKLSQTPVGIRRRMIQGFANCFLPNFPEAERLLTEAAELAKDRAPELEGEIALRRGTLAFLQNDLDQAEALFRSAQSAAHQLGQSFLEANALGSMGLIETRRQHYDRAIDLYNSSLKLSRSLQARTSEAKTLGNLGWNYLRLGDYENANSALQQAEALSGELGLYKDQVIRLLNLGRLSTILSNYALADSYYSRALQAANKLHNKSLTGQALNNLAIISLLNGKLDQAEKYNREALKIRHENGDRLSELYSRLTDARIAAAQHHFVVADTYLLKKIKKTHDPALAWDTHAELASLYVSENRLSLAEGEFRKSLGMLDQARQAILEDEYRLPFLTSAGDVYTQYIELLVSQKKIREALQVADLSRARTLLDGLEASVPVHPKIIPEQIARQTGAVVFSYWLGPQRSYLWVITSKQVEMFYLLPAKDIDAAVNAYARVLAGPHDVLLDNNSHGQALYRILVEPAQRLISPGSKVLVIPHGSLNRLNFETLIVPGENPHYWIEDALIANANSMALLERTNKSTPQMKKGLLLIGNPVALGDEFPSLAGAEKEIESIRRNFPTEDQTLITGPEATPGAYIRSRPGEYRLIHFVAHGTASRTRPLDSALILSRNGDLYKLYARDIMHERLNADLVTIASCYGSGTKVYFGEGLVGLSWAFLRAGARHVIAAQWEANDTSTPLLMNMLYSEIKEGADPIVALHNAKLKLLHAKGVFREPFYWAPFQVYVRS
jgi:CHAT domain-containing protein/Tfp pilus assembly protein PilF